MRRKLERSDATPWRKSNYQFGHPPRPPRRRVLLPCSIIEQSKKVKGGVGTTTQQHAPTACFKKARPA